jgi:hypothetical protein
VIVAGKNATRSRSFGPGHLGRAAPTRIRGVTGVRNAPRCDVDAAPERTRCIDNMVTKGFACSAMMRGPIVVSTLGLWNPAQRRRATLAWGGVLVGAPYDVRFRRHRDQEGESSQPRPATRKAPVVAPGTDWPRGGPVFRPILSMSAMILLILS